MDESFIEKVVKLTTNCEKCAFEPECTYDLFNHAPEEHGDMITCNTCGKAYKDASDLYMHERCMHKLFACRYCDTTCSSNKDWRNHEENFHTVKFFGFGLYDTSYNIKDFDPVEIEVISVFTID